MFRHFDTKYSSMYISATSIFQGLPRIDLHQALGRLAADAPVAESGRLPRPSGAACAKIWASAASAGTGTDP